MNILWLSWKDHEHPQAGGAELLLRELNQRLIREGHDVTVLTVGYPGAERISTLNGVTVIRIGRNRYLHSFQALAYYLKHLRNAFDVVIEVVNTAPYFSKLFGGSKPIHLFYHQLARDVWFYETTFPVNRLGFHVLEPFASRLLGRTGASVITVSESTRQDLIRHGFSADKIHIISEGTDTPPLETLHSITKFTRPTLLSLGAIRHMKRTLDQIKAFEFAKRRLPELQLIVAGDAAGKYGQEVATYAAASPFSQDITILGRVSTDEKRRLMQKSHVLAVTSIKEGWGLVVTEAASQGTPAVVYDVDGLRDSVRHAETGWITAPEPQALAHGITRLLNNQTLYQELRREAWRWSKTINFDQSYNDFKEVVFA